MQPHRLPLRPAAGAALLLVPLSAASAQRVPVADPVTVTERAPVPSATQTEVTPPATPAPTSALFWADWSGDGLLDAWAVQPDGSGLLLENDGQGGFRDRTKSSGLAHVSGAHYASWGDVDGDGLLDLYLASWTGKSTLFVQANIGDFVDVTEPSGLNAGDLPTEARFIDFDADRVADLHLTTLTEEILYRGLGRARFERVDLGLLPKDPSAIVAGAAPTAAVPSRPAPPSAAAAGIAGAVTPGGPFAAGTNDLICAGAIEDQATGTCINASSIPALGSLFPLSIEFNVDPATGRVGIGTTTPAALLDVAGDMEAITLRSTVVNGTPPLSVNSTTLVDNLNVDQLDGLDASDFMLAGASISGAQITDGTISNSDIAPFAAIDGIKITPNFANQEVLSTTGFTADVPFLLGTSAVKGQQVGLDCFGFMGLAAGGAVIPNNPPAWDGLDLGLAGISNGGSTGDNYGVIGHSNNVGVRGEYAINPTEDFGELGLNGTGVYGKGSNFAARFDGNVRVESDNTATTPALEVVGSGITRTARIESNAGSQALLVQSFATTPASASTCTYVRQENHGIAALIESSSTTATLPVMRVSGISGEPARDTVQLQHTGIGGGNVLAVDSTNPTSPSNGITVDVAGNGTAGEFESSNGISVDANRVSNAGTILQARNSSDIEFRVDSGGDVFCDLAFNGGGADYAEWLEQRDPTEVLRKGDVVGVFAGKVTRTIEGADTVLVVSTNPVLVGNAGDAETSEREGHAIIAFLGQVPVRCRGAVRAGDFLVPSGLADGTAIAVAPRDLVPAHFDRVLGRAWESTDGRGIATVNAAVGLDRGAVAKAALAAVHGELEQMRSAVGALAERLDALENQR